MLNRFSADANSIHDRTVTRGTMRLDHVSVQSQKWRAAVTVRVHALLDILEALRRQRRAQLPHRAARQFALDQPDDAFAHVFDSLEDKVPDETIRHHHLDMVVK